MIEFKERETNKVIATANVAYLASAYGHTPSQVAESIANELAFYVSGVVYYDDPETGEYAESDESPLWTLEGGGYRAELHDRPIR